MVAHGPCTVWAVLWDMYYAHALCMCGEPLLKDTSEVQPPPVTGHHGSAPFDIPFIDMCNFKSSEIRTPPYTGQLTVVPMVSLV